MSRVVRIEYPGAIYHVTCRGNDGQPIFLGKKGHESFLDTLDEACQRAGWIVHAFVLMGNHYHLLLETPEGNLVEGMKWFQGTYTQRVNNWMKRRGHLFQGRYKAQVVNGEQRDEDYFRVVSEYIHLNPARARMTGRGKEWEQLSDYPWSSLGLYLGRKAKRPSWLKVEKVLASHCFKDTTAGRESYGKFLNARGEEVQGGKAGMGYEQLRRGWCLGDGDFRQKMLDLAENALEGRKKESLSGQLVREHSEGEFLRLLEEGMEKLELSEERLRDLKKSAPEKKALAAWLVSQTLVGTEQVAEKLEMGHRSAVSQAKRWAKESKEGRKWMKKLRRSRNKPR